MLILLYLVFLTISGILPFAFKRQIFRSIVVVHDIPDLGDTPFVEMAIYEDVPLITGNMKHFPRQVRKGCIVVSPV